MIAKGVVLLCCVGLIEAAVAASPQIRSIRNNGRAPAFGCMQQIAYNFTAPFDVG